MTCKKALCYAVVSISDPSNLPLDAPSSDFESMKRANADNTLHTVLYENTLILVA
jgi:hypothetical protein